MLGDRSGGNETFYSGILENMQVPNDLEIYLFVSQPANVETLKDKFKVVYFKSSNAFIRNFIELPLLCLKYKLSVLHTQYFIPFFRFCPVVCTIHDICFEHFKDIFTTKEYVRQKILIPYAARHSRAIYTVSEFSRKDICERYKIPKERVFVVYNSPKKIFRKLSANDLKLEELKQKFGISNNFVLSVGNLQPRKNLARLIKAFCSLKDCGKIGKCQLVIVGKKAWLFNDIIQAATTNKNDVIFTDYVTEDELVRLYNVADYFVYPSFFEGFGLPPVEAMACGTAVAVSNQSALPEVVGNAGSFFDPFNEKDIEKKIYQLYSDINLRAQLVNEGFKQIKEYNWTQSATEVLQVYKKILAEIR